ncbi:ubiquitin-associated and SH3 domain-containing protein B isoform X1 [Pieris rapae]|uniref:ubiquitin-associated and SH3 domain-containing protein B isoform X1 n=1 Tax=Pieris rapae TaxID=64459 RepID=UPI001E27FE42|nr:ubiquitin-associated and SH3 domain-containing protein B isoform X1 [Pieris rapae]
MTNLPPRKFSTSSKTSKQDSTPLQILLQMGFPKNRVLKALAATGNRSVQLASDWLLTHVNDALIDVDQPREYIFYASPTGPLLTQLREFWEKSKAVSSWNRAHNFPPHITLVSFFKAADEASLQLAKAVKQVVEMVGDPPMNELKLEPYVSHNFMGLFLSEEHAEYLKKIAVQFVKEVSSILGVKVDTYEHLDALGACFPWCTMAQEKDISTNLEAHVKSLHITLAYHFEASAYDALKKLVEELKPETLSSWELRLYSRDPRFANHLVHKVTQSYVPVANDELELVIGDYIYIEEKQFDSSPDGWVYGTSWLTGVSGYLPAVYTQRTAESDAWTLHRTITLGNNLGAESKSESKTDADMAGYPHEDASNLAQEKSEDTYKDWENYWKAVTFDKAEAGILNVIGDRGLDLKSEKACGNGDTASMGDCKEAKAKGGKERRWMLGMRHGERVDLTYGAWVPYCFDDNGTYVRKDLNMPLKLGERKGGNDSYALDTPLTRVGHLQAQLVGEGMRLNGVTVKHVYASAALRSIETAHSFLQGLQADPSVKVRVEPGLFEYKMWYLTKGMPTFMTPQELHDAGLNVDVDYKPYIDLDPNTPETLDDFFKRNELVMQSAWNESQAEGGNIMFVGHAATLDLMVLAFKRLAEGKTDEPNYQISQNLLRVPYCAVGAVRDNPWEVVSPPCPPSINSNSARYNWKTLLDI